jgi:hypothetical protein
MEDSRLRVAERYQGADRAGEERAPDSIHSGHIQEERHGDQGSASIAVTAEPDTP